MTYFSSQSNMHLVFSIIWILSIKLPKCDLLRGACHGGHCPGAAPELPDDADVAEGHEEGRDDEHGDQLVEGHGEPDFVIGVPAVEGRDARLVVEVGDGVDLLGNRHVD